MEKVYTKDDYLTAAAYAKKHDLDVATVKLAIAKLRGVLVDIGHAKTSIIVRFGNRDSGNTERIRPEPAAQEMFAKKIKQIQEAKK